MVGRFCKAAMAGVEVVGVGPGGVGHGEEGGECL